MKMLFLHLIPGVDERQKHRAEVGRGHKDEKKKYLKERGWDFSTWSSQELSSSLILTLHVNEKLIPLAVGATLKRNPSPTYTLKPKKKKCCY